jgi:hypothetical protein
MISQFASLANQRSKSLAGTHRQRPWKIHPAYEPPWHIHPHIPEVDLTGVVRLLPASLLSDAQVRILLPSDHCSIVSS